MALFGKDATVGLLIYCYTTCDDHCSANVLAIPIPWGYIGGGYVGIMQKKMESTMGGYKGFRV